MSSGEEFSPVQCLLHTNSLHQLRELQVYNNETIDGQTCDLAYTHLLH